MDKTLLVITEHFASSSQEERGILLQQAVDRYLYLALKNGLPAPEQEAEP